MIDIEQLKQVTRESFWVNENILRTKFADQTPEDIQAAVNLIQSSPNIFRRLDDNNFTIYSKKEYKNIKKLLEAKKQGSHIEISGKKKDGTEYFRKGTVDGFVFTTKGKTLVRIQDELRSRYSNFYISENKMDSVRIVGPKKFQK
jgi:hypothetical protein